MDKQFNVEDESGDRKFFTIVPNYIANHSTAVDQALYLQIKRMAGDGGECYYSCRTLMKKLGIGFPRLKKSINYLLEHKWISEKGFRLIETSNGPQMIKVYAINDIWRLNNTEFMKKTRVLPTSNTGGGGVAEKQGGVLLKDTGGVAKQQPIKNPDQEPITKRAFSKEKAEVEKLIKEYRPKFLDKMIIN